MIISNSTNYKPLVSNENGRDTYNKTPELFQNALSDIVSKKELESNDNSLVLYTDFDVLPSSQNCEIDNKKIDEAAQNRADEITEENEKTKSSYEICCECDHKDECENYRKMIEDKKSLEENAKKLNENFLQEQLYKLNGKSIIYNYNIVCLDINYKTKREKK